MNRVTCQDLGSTSVFKKRTSKSTLYSTTRQLLKLTSLPYLGHAPLLPLFVIVELRDNLIKGNKGE